APTAPTRQTAARRESAISRPPEPPAPTAASRGEGWGPPSARATYTTVIGTASRQFHPQSPADAPRMLDGPFVCTIYTGQSTFSTGRDHASRVCFRNG